ncbi:hypothetical protein MMC31_000126 [Peltigera leucophlebia]|nr:hypothetical protein [Peltigera leucophlebia]
MSYGTRYVQLLLIPRLPPRPASSFQQTSGLHNTGSFASSTERRNHVDDVLKEELGPIYVGTPGFSKAFFGKVGGLGPAAQAMFEKCKEGGSTADRKLDVGFADDPSAAVDSKCHWSQILIPGELKSNASASKAFKAGLNLGRYAREMLAAQDSRRLVLGFTLCGSLMRMWQFDRLGGIPSAQSDVNQEGLQFVSAMLGFSWMNEEQLGFDPTILKAKGRRYIEIERNGQLECLVSMRGVVNVARYHHHETVRVGGHDDDIRENFRKGPDISKAANHSPKSSMLPPSTAGHRISSTAGRKRSPSCRGVALPPSKRSRSNSPTKGGTRALNRPVVVCDYLNQPYSRSNA